MAYDSLKAFLKRQGSNFKIGSFGEFENRFKSEKIFPQVVMDVHNVELRSKEFFFPKDSIQEVIGHLYSGGKTVRFEDARIRVLDRSEHEIPLAYLSSGEKHLLRILVETLLVEESSLLIDEPELSLHVDWQHDIVAAISRLNPAFQLIAATHSPEVISQLPEDKVRKL